MMGLGLGLGLHRNQVFDGTAIAIDFRGMSTGSTPSGFTFTRSTAATYWGADGLLQSAAINAMRISRDPVSGELGYLAEPQRTNLLLRSEQFDNASWSKANMLAFGAGSVADATTSPDGASSADLIVPTVASATHAVSQAATVTAASYSVSVFVKPAGYSKFGIREANVTGAYSTFDLTGSGSVIVSSASTATILAVGGGWYRLVMVYTGTAASHTFVLHVMDSSYASGSPHLYTWSGNGTSGVYIWGAQVELGSYPTSYMPTTTATVTRGADLLTHTLSGANATALSTAGTMVCRFSFLGGDSTVDSGSRVVMSIDNGTTAERILIYNQAGAVGVLCYSGGGAVASPSVAGAIPTNTPTKVAFGFSGSAVPGSASFNLAKNGTLGTLDTTGAAPVVTTLAIGGESFTSALNFGGLIHSVSIYTSRLTDAQLQAMSQ